MIITREKGMRMWGGGSGNTSVSGASSGGGFSLTVAEGEGTGNAYTDFTYESGTLTLNKATEFVTVDFFNKLFTAYDANGNVIAPNNTTPTLDNIKFRAGAWTEQYLSALGQNSSGGGGGGGGIELSDVWQSLKTNTDDYANQKINAAHIPDLSGTYATKTWVNQQGFVTSSGVTSVAMTVPTGLSVSGSPITSTGTLALTFATGYSIPTTAKQGNWDTAYGWGNHATAGYAMGTTSIITGNGLTGGGTLAADRTLSIQLQTNSGLAVSSSGLKLDIINNLTTESAYKAISATQAKKIWDLLNQMFTLEGAGTTASPYVIKANYGLYTEQFLSALGQNSSGGGGGDFDEAQMWTALQSTSGTYATTKIATSHIPDMASTYGYVKSSGVTSVATGTGLTGGTITSTGTISINSTYQTYISNGNTAYGWGNHATAGYALASDVYSSSASRTKNYVLAAPSTANGAATFRKLVASDIPDLSSTYATDARVDALEGYFNTGGVAKVAAKLNTGTTTYTAWGQTYWSSGVPSTISGDISNVGNITPSASASKDIGTRSNYFRDIYGRTVTLVDNTTNEDMLFGWRDVTISDVSTRVFTMYAYETKYSDIIIGASGLNTSTYKPLFFDASAHMWGIGTLTPAYTLDVKGSIASTDAITLAGTTEAARRIYFGDTSHYIELTSTGFHFSHGVYSDSFVSALGANSSGGGSGTFDEEAMWTALGTTITAKVIASSHIPNLAASKITSGTFASARIPIATASAVGGIKVGTTLAISDGVLNQKSGIATAGTYRSVTVDTYGRVTAGTNPTTISGYGISDAYTKTQVDNALSGYLPLSGGTMSGNITMGKNAIVFNSTHDASWNVNSGAGLRILNTVGASAEGAFSNYAVALSVAGYYRFQIAANASDSTDFRMRFGSGDWYSLLNSGNYNSYAPTLTGTGASGTWGISVTGNAATATTLQTSRTIWGQSFDGSGNVSGQMSNVGHIYPASTGSYNIGSRTNYFNSLFGINITLVDNTTDEDMVLTWKSVTVGGSSERVFTMYAYETKYSDIILGQSGSIAGGGIFYDASADSVGIGTYTPAYKLDVDGDVRADNFRGSLIGNAATATSLATPRTIWGQSFNGSANITGALTNVTGITMSSHLTATTPSTSGIYLRAANNNGSVELYAATNRGVYDRTTTNWIIATDGTNTWLSQGNVGIGTSSPSYKLHVVGTAYASSAFDVAAGSTSTLLGYKVAGGTVLRATSADGNTILSPPGTGGGIYFYSKGSGDNSVSSCIDNNGNVGIGTISPSYKLHVYGNIAATTANSGTIRLVSANSINYIQSGNAAFDGNVDMMISGYASSKGTNLTLNFNTVNVTNVLKVKANLTLGYDAEGIYLTGSGIYWHNASNAWTKTIMGFASTGATSINGNLTVFGEVTATSDERKKNIISNTKFNVRDIASARSVLFEWNDGRDKDNSKKIHGGSIAQDWLGKADSFLSQDKDGWYSINYGALALCSAITIARMTINHEDRITILEKENAKLKARVAELEERRIA